MGVACYYFIIMIRCSHSHITIISFVNYKQPLNSIIRSVPKIRSRLFSVFDTIQACCVNIKINVNKFKKMPTATTKTTNSIRDILVFR